MLTKYDMISDGDRIVVGLSGGKDSFTLMWVLKERLSRIPINYDLFAVYKRDDIIETLFLNMCYAGEISTMVPLQLFFQERFTIIRPLAFTDEDTIRRFAREKRFPDFVNPCPSAKNSKRQGIKKTFNTALQQQRKN